MGRRSSFTDEKVFAVVAGLAETGQAPTIQAISQAAGLSVGSLYHRFGSREGLLAETWLDAVTVFQTGFMTALEQGGRAAALETPRFCRRDPVRARVLSGLSRNVARGAHLPGNIAGQLDRVNQRNRRALKGFSQLQDMAPLLCRLALVEMPLTVVRLYLPARPVPEEAELFVARAYDGLMCRAGA